MLSWLLLYFFFLSEFKFRTFIKIHANGHKDPKIPKKTLYKEKKQKKECISYPIQLLKGSFQSKYVFFFCSSFSLIKQKVSSSVELFQSHIFVRTLSAVVVIYL